jgi:hypothetical protein
MDPTIIRVAERRMKTVCNAVRCHRINRRAATE